MDKTRKELTDIVIKQTLSNIDKSYDNINSIKKDIDLSLKLLNKLKSEEIYPCYECESSGKIYEKYKETIRVEDPDAMNYGGYMYMQYRDEIVTKTRTHICPKCNGKKYLTQKWENEIVDEKIVRTMKIMEEK